MTILPGLPKTRTPMLETQARNEQSWAWPRPVTAALPISSSMACPSQTAALAGC